jgi:hypothetical protein
MFEFVYTFMFVKGNARVKQTKQIMDQPEMISEGVEKGKLFTLPAKFC